MTVFLRIHTFVRVRGEMRAGCPSGGGKLYARFFNLTWGSFLESPDNVSGPESYFMSARFT